MQDREEDQQLTTWKILDQDALHWQKWDDLYILYYSLSGETHLLPESSAQVLKQLSTRPRSVSDIAQTLVQNPDDSSDSQIVENISNILQQLEVAGLTEKVRF